MIKKALVGLIFLPLISFIANGALIVIDDAGPTVSLQSYLPEKKQSSKTKPKHLPYALPITSPSLQVGDVTTTQRQLRYLMQPLFLVGADTRSQQWLMSNKEKLQRMGAVGLLIQAESQDDVDRMFMAASGLRMIPASAESIANRLGLTHYPVLLSREGWEQ